MPKSHSPADPFWAGPADDLLAGLGSSSAGLTSGQAAARAASRPPDRHRASLVSAPRLLLRQIANPLVLLLLAAMVVAFVVGETTDALVVLGIVAASTLLGFVQEYRAGGAVARLLERIEVRATVLRDGREVELPFGEVVPGDVICLSAGSTVPGDGRLLSARDLFVDEASLTGEAFPVEKSVDPAPAGAALAHRVNAVFQGTHVVSGVARAIMVRLGRETELGRVAGRLRRAPPETEFERGVRTFGNFLVRVTLVLVLVIFAINVWLDRPVLHALLFSLALAVGMTPELLPAIVTVTLSTGARRMARARVIVRRLGAIEDVGSMDVLCADKTGTLTEGVMSRRGAVDCTGRPSEAVVLHAWLNAALESGFVNPIDAALRAAPPPGADPIRWRKVDEVPYDFVRKRLSVVVEDRTAPGRSLMITKGAVRNVLEVCSRAALGGDPRGETAPLAEQRALVEARFAQASAEGLRVIAVAAKDVTGDPTITRDDETDLTLLGLVAFESPLKADAEGALAELAGLGVSLKIITGDNRHVAAGIAARLGLAPALLTGPELRELTDEALDQRVEAVSVIAEVEPNQKERIIVALKRRGHVVGFLGDGINDASAIHAADVGISVESAVDVAKAAADLVLLDRDLAVLAEGIRQGRRTFANTLKYVYTTTSANFGNMLSMAGASLLLPFLPLLPKQILLNNFLSDLPAMTIATDRVDPELVSRPRRWDVRRIRRAMIGFGLVSSAFDFLTFGLLLVVLRAGEAEFQTGWFVESLLTELFIVFVIRTGRAAWASRPGWLLAGATIAVTGLALTLPFLPLTRVFGFVPLPPRFLGVLALVTMGYLVASETIKRRVFRTG